MEFKRLKHTDCRCLTQDCHDSKDFKIVGTTQLDEL